MGYFIAEHGGEHYVGSNEEGLTQEGFAELVRGIVRKMPEDERTPQELDLYEADDGDQFFEWMFDGVSDANPYALIRYDYAGNGEGDWFIYPPDEPPQRRHPDFQVTSVYDQEADDAYAPDNPKHPTFYERMSALWDNRKK